MALVVAAWRLWRLRGGFVQIGIPTISTTDYSLRGCWGFMPPFGLGLPNYPSQIPLRRRYGGYRFFPTGYCLPPDGHFFLSTDISPSRQALPPPKEQLPPLQTLNFCREERIELQHLFHLLINKAAKFCNLLGRTIVLTSERLGKFQALLG